MVIELEQWLQKERTKQKIDLRTLSNKTGIDIGTISRIENMRTQATLATIVRLCEGLGVGLSTLLEALQQKPDVDLDSTDTSDCEAIPTLNDVQTFLRSISNDWQAGCLLLADMLNTIASIQLRSGFMDSQGVSHLFVPEDVDKFLLHLPLYRFELVYPPRLAADDIWRIYRCGGWLTVTDVGMYIKQVRSEKPFSSARPQHTAKISGSVLTRLEEGVLERVKFSDVLLLDEQLEQDGKLLAMYWKAYQLSREMTEFLSERGHQQKNLPLSPWIGRQERLLFMFTVLCRWSQLGDQHVRFEMDTLLKRSLQSTSLVESISAIDDPSHQ